MAAVKQIFAAAFAFGIVLIFQTYLSAQTVGYNHIFLGSKYSTIKEILQYHDYRYKEMKVGAIKVIEYGDSQSSGMLIFDLFDRLYTVIVTIPVTDSQYEQLQHHLQQKYGEFTFDKNAFYCSIGMYRVGLYYNKAAKTATVEYSHVMPLFYPKVPEEKNPFSQF
ncbi:MAG: hypothetical protein N3F66_12330 [Spirochaetes bacterium]|nr:hypothetical protein [Spirochaetota bacterium]